jgi:hypothetical protein
MQSILNKKGPNRGMQLILGLGLIFVMLFSTLSYAFGDRESGNSNKIDYNGVEFIQDASGYWNFNIQGLSFLTRYNPLEIEDISFFSSLNINKYVNEPLYFVGGFNEPTLEINRNVAQVIMRVNEACLSENCEGDLPTKNCSVDNVIVIKEPDKESERIYQEENCVFIVADLGNQTLYADKFLFHILGI